MKTEIRSINLLFGRYRDRQPAPTGSNPSENRGFPPLFSSEHILSACEKLSQVMGRANQFPLGTNRRNASHEKRSYSPRIFDLSEDRLNDDFAFCVNRLAGFRQEFPLHYLFDVQTAGDSSSRRFRTCLFFPRGENDYIMNEDTQKQRKLKIGAVRSGGLNMAENF